MTKELSLLYKSGIFALIAIGLLALVFMWTTYSQNKRSNMKTLPTQGRAEITVKPNKATLSATFEAEGKDAGEATAKLSDKLNTVIAALDNEGVKPEDRKTEQFYTNPKYEQCNYVAGRVAPCPSNPKIIAYTATQTLTVNFKIENDNKTQLEKIMGLLPSLGAMNVSGPNLSVDNKDAINQAREEAIKDARTKAEITAKALGMKLGDVMYYSENNGGPGGGPMPIYSARADVMMMKEAAPVAVELGSDKVVMTVDVTYELK